MSGSGPSVKGWCPGALRPMATGDGLVLRIRPHGGRLSPGQALALADLAEAHGSGLIDLGSRAHLQLRGIRNDALPALHAGLAAQDLLDPDPAREARRNILTTPVWHDETTLALVKALEAALVDAPELPPKFGFAVDTGPRAVLGRDSADIRIERAAMGLILRADGLEKGMSLTAQEAPARAVGLARWFARHRGTATRMSQLIATGAQPPLDPDLAPLAGPRLAPGPTDFGLCLGLPFGQMTAAMLRALAIAPLRLTPWRSIVVEGVHDLASPPGLIVDPADPLLRVAACTGAPGCASAKAPTRVLARALAPLVPDGCRLHVSGCAKGCAHPQAASVTLVGTKVVPEIATEPGARFDLVLNGRASDDATLRALDPETLFPLLRGHFASHL